MICFMLFMACKREKPKRRSEPSDQQAENLTVIVWLTGTRFNSKSDARNYKTELKP